MRSQTVGSLMGLLTMVMRQVFQHLIQCPRAFPRADELQTQRCKTAAAA